MTALVFASLSAMLITGLSPLMKYPLAGVLTVRVTLNSGMLRASFLVQS